MATYEEMFGKKSSGDKKYIKWEKVGEVLFFRVTGEPYEVPQVNFTTKKAKFMVQEVKGGKWGPKDEGSFDPNGVESCFPLQEWAIPVTVTGKKGTDGEMVADFEEFDAEWAPSQNQNDKLKDAMLETEIPIQAGTIIAVKWALDEKPRKYIVKLAAGE